MIAASCFAGELILEPLQVHNGEVAILRWVGQTPSFAVVRFHNKATFLYPDEDGALALLPVGLDVKDGSYPLMCAVVDDRGKTVFYDLSLQVVHKERPIEHLKLPENMVSPKDPEVIERINNERKKLSQLFSVRSQRRWDSFGIPVDDPVNSVFGKQRVMHGTTHSLHSGTDFRSPMGRPIRSVANGKVVMVDELFYTGNTVILDHGEGLYSLYGHMSKTSVIEGEEVQVGDSIGNVGRTGRVTGPHLHLSMRLLGERIDPMSLISLLAE
ncbi:MAG: peptidoglycan DD-metalloendopeptidase family protein [Deltaproteobacteria bacterium]|jgi:murein DD-endopeptidase MepM/ murein hydrolase activator NlpD|nr:peptidoglycan DD-metalloendopeptidase family protein [Deltaproteobacteria bacterium]